MEHPLDRPIWTALTTRQAHLAEGDPTSGALRFPPDIEPFGATADDSVEKLQALGALTPKDNGFALIQAQKVTSPPGLVTLMEAVIHQMTAPCLTEGPKSDFEIQPLGETDAPQMRALAELTQPGPFHARTHTLGDFVGVRENGKLIAMAGERMRVPGYTEISAVCTHPDARGRGLAAALMQVVAAKIVARGEKLVLHVYPSNIAAIAIYERLGFTRRADLHLHVMRHLQPGETQ